VHIRTLGINFSDGSEDLRLTSAHGSDYLTSTLVNTTKDLIVTPSMFVKNLSGLRVVGYTLGFIVVANGFERPCPNNPAVLSIFHS
jgi:hypothetical protein